MPSQLPATGSSCSAPVPAHQARRHAACSVAAPKHAPVALRQPRLASGGSRRHCRLPLRAAASAAAVAAAGAQPEQPEQAEQLDELLLDLVLPAPPDVVCRAVFGAGSTASGSGDSSGSSQPTEHGLLVDCLQPAMGCTQVSVDQPWQPSSSSSGSSGSSSSGSSSSGSSSRQRLLQYRTPLSARQRLLLPLGPRDVHNTEEQQALEQPGGIVVSIRCTSAGVPFADCFTNLLLWQLVPVAGEAAASNAGSDTGRVGSAAAAESAAGLQPWSGSGTTRVLLTADCRFHKSLLGPVRKQIERESMQASAGQRWLAVLL